jgi:hypothetical protein
MTLLNDDQQRRLGTHLRLLISDLDTIAESPGLARDGRAFARVRDEIAATRRAAEEMRAALALPLDHGPSLKRRVAAVAAVWAARIDDLRARRLRGYGPVHPGLAERLDPRVDDVRRHLEALAVAAAALPEGGA